MTWRRRADYLIYGRGGRSAKEKPLQREATEPGLYDELCDKSILVCICVNTS